MYSHTMEFASSRLPVLGLLIIVLLTKRPGHPEG
jgi:hypothetical protein